MAGKKKSQCKTPGTGWGGVRNGSGQVTGMINKAQDPDGKLALSAREVLESIGARDPLQAVAEIMEDAKERNDRNMELAAAGLLLRYIRPQLQSIAHEFADGGHGAITISLTTPDAATRDPGDRDGMKQVSGTPKPVVIEQKPEPVPETDDGAGSW